MPRKRKAEAIENEEQITENGAVKTRSAVLSEKEQSRILREARIAENEKKASSESTIESMRRNKTFVKAKIVGVEEMTINEQFTICAAAIPLKNMKFSIPFEEMYTTTVIDMSTVDLKTANGIKQYYARQKQMLTKMLGLTVDVCIKEVIPNYDGAGHEAIIASRREASAKLRDIMFDEKNARCKEGEFYEATIISVSPHSLAATFNGVDFVKQQNDLTERYLVDLQQHYKPGDKLAFQLEKIDRGEDNISITANTKASELKTARERQYLISANTVARGVITRIYKAGDRINIFAWLPDYEMPCKIAFMNANDFGREPVSGDEVQVIINGFRESGYLDARCRSLHGSAGLFSSF